MTTERKEHAWRKWVADWPTARSYVFVACVGEAFILGVFVGWFLRGVHP